MSEEGAHSTNGNINLRDFRIQKKPMLSHQNQGPTTGQFPSITLPNYIEYFIEPLASQKKFQRIVMNLTSESDSDDPPARHSNQNNRNQPQKSIVVLERERQMRFLLENFPKTEAMVTNNNNHRLFPAHTPTNIHLFQEIHNMLSKYLFDADTAAFELSRTMGIPTYIGGYKKWKSDNNLSDFECDTAAVSGKRKAPVAFGNSSKKKGEQFI